MEPENDFGNREYKLMLINKNNDRIDELVSQMRFRCEEGNGECFYNLGVDDKGNLVGISDDEFKETYNNLSLVAEKNDYSIQILSKTPVEHDENYSIYELLIRENNENKYIDIKVAIAGNVDSSKSTTLGCLITGKLDNGRGLTRMSVFNYVHELKTGRTSSIAHEILGFDSKGSVVNYQGLNKISWNDIVQRSSKIISFYDLAGHEKYLKTTILGLASSLPNICMIMISANNGICKMTKEHIFLCITMKIPFIFVVSKIDLCNDRKNVLKDTIDQINKLCKHVTVRRIPVHIKNIDDIILSVKNMYSNSITPVFQISNVTGEGLDNLRKFFNILGEKPKEKVDDVEYFIDNIFNVKGVGVVVGGHLLSGKVNVGDTLLIGPNLDSSFENVVVKSIHCKKVNVQSVNSGSYVCMSFKKLDKKFLRKGIAILSNKKTAKATWIFDAKIDVMRSHSTTIKEGYEPLFCCNSIRQSVMIKDIKDKTNSRNVKNDDNILRTNDSAKVKIQFKYRPEFIKTGARFLLCEGNLKIIGEIL